VGMDYVSASPFRVPISRLAAAQAVLEGAKAGKRKVKEKRVFSGNGVKRYAAVGS